MAYISFVKKGTKHNKHLRKTPLDVLLSEDYKQLYSKNFYRIGTIYVPNDKIQRSSNFYLIKYWLDSVVLNIPPKDYHIFKIPKASGGFRSIESPSDELKRKQKQASNILYNKFNFLPHDAAYAYVKGRSAYDSLVTHQRANARWFLKIDIKDFFTSITKEILKDKLSDIYPFCLFTGGLLDDIIELATNENGVLPQGSPLSPILSNAVMVEFDHKLTKRLNQFTYTRYADDLLISSPYKFQFKEVLKIINEILQECNLPLKFNKDKIRFGSLSGKNWNLGLMYNQEQRITIGHRKKRILHSLVYEFMKNPQEHTQEQVYSIIGQLGYLKFIEPDYYNKLINKYSNKFNTPVLDAFKGVL